MGMFNKEVEAPKTAKKGKSVDMVPTSGLQLYAALQALKTNVEAQIAVVEVGLKDAILDRAAKLKNTDSWKATEKGSTGSMQLRTRSTRSTLSDEEQQLFDDNEIPYAPQVETWTINPEYAGDEDLLAKIEAALDVIVPDGFFQKQIVSKPVATDESIKTIMGKGDNLRRALLKTATTPAIRSTFLGKDPLEVAGAVLAVTEEEAA